MKRLVAAMAFTLAASPLALAQDVARDAEGKAPAATEKSARKAPSEKQKAHQARMRDCAARAEGRKGEERKQFMSACLKGGNAAAAPGETLAQQDRKKACGKEAGDRQLKGRARKEFVSACVKG